MSVFCFIFSQRIEKELPDEYLAGNLSLLSGRHLVCPKLTSYFSGNVKNNLCSNGANIVIYSESFVNTFHFFTLIKPKTFNLAFRFGACHRWQCWQTV